MKTLLAWWFITVSFETRAMYQALAQLMESRAFYGTNVFRLFIDGILLLLVSCLLIVLPLVAAVTFPFTSLALLLFNRDSYRTTMEMVKAGRVDWSHGKIMDAKEPESEDEDS